MRAREFCVFRQFSYVILCMQVYCGFVFRQYSRILCDYSGWDLLLCENISVLFVQLEMLKLCIVLLSKAWGHCILCLLRRHPQQ